jgi:predicted MFS family arabinose efflux permease
MHPTLELNRAQSPRRTIIISTLALTFGRLVVNTTRRFPYPFLPTIGRQLNVSLGSVQAALAVQAGTGVASPLFGPYSERYGRKRVMMATLMTIAAAGVFGAILPHFWMFAIAMIVMGIAKMIYDPAMQAYMGDRVPYHRRGAAMGFAELSWAGSLLVSAPVAGFLLGFSHLNLPDALIQGSIVVPAIFTLTTTGLQLVFGMITIASLVALGMIGFLIPSDRPEPGAEIQPMTPLVIWRAFRGNPTALGAIGFSFLLATANEIFFINYGAWMEQSFELALTALGAVTVVIAVAEVSGEFTVMTIADRFGKRRLALLGSVVASSMYIILPNLTGDVRIAMVGLFLLFLGVETAIVAAIPLFTEIMPESRSIMMSGMIGSSSGGRLMGGVIGGILYTLVGNFVVMGIVAMCISFTSLFLLWRFVQIE